MITIPLWEQWPVRLKRCREGAMLYNINDTYIGRALDSYGEISRGEPELFQQLLRPSMTAIEVGANIGVHTVALARFVGPQGTVIAFEPQRIVFQMLCANVALNALTNVTTYQSAVGRAPGFITVPRLDYSKPGNFGGVSLGAAEDGERVNVVTIDSLTLPSCELLKIDVEGMERDCHRGRHEHHPKISPPHVCRKRPSRKIPSPDQSPLGTGLSALLAPAKALQFR